MSKSKLVPALALVLGGLGAALRMWQRSAGYDGVGLPIPGSPAAVVLSVFLALCAAAALLFALPQPRSLTDQSAAAPRGRAHGALLAFSGGMVAVGGILSLMEFADGYLALSQALYASAEAQSQAARAFLLTHLLPLALAVAAIPAAAALFFQARQALANGEGAVSPFAALIPPFFSWLWLIETYRQHTSNPIIWDYALLLFAVVALLLSGYYRAGFAFGAGRPRRTVFTSLLALFFSAAAVPDCDGPVFGFLIGLALQTLTELISLLDACARQPAQPAPAQPDQTTQQEGTTHEQ